MNNIKPTERELAMFNTTEAALNSLAEEFETPFDFGSVAGYKRGEDAIKSVKKLKNAITKKRAELNADDNAKIKARNAVATKIIDTLEGLIKVAVEQKDEVDRAEEIRIEKEREAERQAELQRMRDAEAAAEKERKALADERAAMERERQELAAQKAALEPKVEQLDETQLREEAVQRSSAPNKHDDCCGETTHYKGPSYYDGWEMDHADLVTWLRSAPSTMSSEVGKDMMKKIIKFAEAEASLMEHSGKQVP